ncbi:sugar porter family MFS transporter [Labilibaculum sp. DW002]|uniref:Sugar porter family MFS transporter n=1 Tax=Paralabilibaculum antarcticum TaxID=2912572 RepID=A0ABT5VPW0_9BACT|nr:MFS transporter [Labilibaculum sp. DW002]MDE5416817.1 sugar porter family MFS transporter [Labilibaculum sp. DW002]
MSLKKSVFVLLILSIIPILMGYDSQLSTHYEHLLANQQHPSYYVDIFNFCFSLPASIGLLVGAFAVDKWNVRKFVTIILALLSASSLLLQFLDSYGFLLSQRFVLGFSSGFLLISCKVFITDIADPKHRGKFLFFFLGASTIGFVSFQIFNSYFYEILADFSYASLQIPFIILPLFLFFIIRYLPNNSSVPKNNLYSLKYLFKPKQRVLILIMVLVATLTTFANWNLYFYVSSQIIFEQQNDLLGLLPTFTGIAGTIFGFIFIDIFGRRGLLKFGIIALIICSATNLVVSLITAEPLLIFGFLYLYSFLFSFTILSTGFIIILEYLPSQIRGRGMLLFSIIWWVPDTINNILNKTLILDSNYNVAISSLIILTTLTISLVITRRHLIETKGLSLEAIKNRINIE